MGGDGALLHLYALSFTGRTELPGRERTGLKRDRKEKTKL